MSKSWRDVLSIHPAADLFPPMSADELKVFGEDIKKGVKVPIVLWKEQKHFAPVLLDGRNRLDAIEAVGLSICVEASDSDADPHIWLGMRRSDDMLSAIEVTEVRGDRPGGNPYDYVISANIHRRHLTAEKKIELVEKVIKLDPTKSNRQIAKATGTSHPTVAKQRAKLEKSGDVETVTTSTDTRGRRQPAHKNGEAKPPPLAEPTEPPIVTADVLEQKLQAEFEATVDPVTVPTLADTKAAKKAHEDTAEQVQQAAESVLMPEQPDLEHVLPVADRLVIDIMERDRIAPGYAKAVMAGIAAKLAVAADGLGIPEFLKREAKPTDRPRPPSTKPETQTEKTA